MKQFSDLLNKLVAEKGQGTLADQIHVDGSALSRFRSGQGCAGIGVVDQVLDVADAVIISRQELKRLEDALETVSDLWKAGRKR